MLFSGVGVALVLQGTKRGDQLGSRLRGLDDCIHVASLGGHVGIREPVPEVIDFLAPKRFTLALGRARSISRL